MKLEYLTKDTHYWNEEKIENWNNTFETIDISEQEEVTGCKNTARGGNLINIYCFI